MQIECQENVNYRNVKRSAMDARWKVSAYVNFPYPCNLLNTRN